MHDGEALTARLLTTVENRVCSSFLADGRLMYFRREQGPSQVAEKLIGDRKKCQGTTSVVP
jgi:hypothetical protein